MFRFPEAPVLHDETSWSAWGTRRRRPASGSPTKRRMPHRAERTSVVQPTALDRRTAQAHTTPIYCADATQRKTEFIKGRRWPREPRSTSTQRQVNQAAAAAPAPSQTLTTRSK